MFIFLTLFTALLSAQPGDEFAAIESRIAAYLERQDIPAASLAIARGGQLVYDRSFGETKANVRYPLASVTKPLTATLIAVLADKELIDLDAPVADYLDADVHYPDSRWQKVTVRHLLTHTSGMGMYYRIYYADEDQTPDPVSTLIERHGYLYHDPGTHFEYSNLGYAILGEIAARVTGQPYPEALRQYVLQPLNMEHTSTGMDDHSPQQYASLYGVRREALPLVYTDTPAAGDGYGTAADLARFGAFHLGHGPQLLPAVARRAMYRGSDTSGVEYANPCHRYGLGFYTSAAADHLWHDGGLDGAGTTLRLLPEEDIALAVLTPVTFTSGAADSIAAILLGELTERELPATCLRTDTGSFDVGSYRGEWPGEITTAEGDVPVKLTFREGGEVLAAFEQPQSNMIFTGGASFPLRIIVDQFSGSAEGVVGWIPTGVLGIAELRDAFHIVQFDLRREGDTLKGAAKVFATNTGREGFGMSFPMRLKRRAPVD
jgi:CubicO group peptidase (beta-lactamase class C family)